MMLITLFMAYMISLCITVAIKDFFKFDVLDVIFGFKIMDWKARHDLVKNLDDKLNEANNKKRELQRLLSQYESDTIQYKNCDCCDYEAIKKYNGNLTAFLLNNVSGLKVEDLEKLTECEGSSLQDVLNSMPMLAPTSELTFLVKNKKEQLRVEAEIEAKNNAKIEEELAAYKTLVLQKASRLIEFADQAPLETLQVIVEKDDYKLILTKEADEDETIEAPRISMLFNNAIIEDALHQELIQAESMMNELEQKFLELLAKQEEIEC